MKSPSAADPPLPGTRDKVAAPPSSIAADAISAKLAPEAMAEPAQRLLAAISHRDAVELEGAIRAFEAKVMQDPALSAYGGRWLFGVSRNHIPGLPDMILAESLLGEMKGGGEALAFGVAQAWAATEQGHARLVRLAEMMIASWRDVHTEAAMRFGCALTTSLAVIHNKLAAALMSRIESVTPVPKGVSATMEQAAAWVDVGRILAQLSPHSGALLEERLADPENMAEWSSLAACQAVEELQPHLAAPSKAARLFHAILPADAWPDMDEQDMGGRMFSPMPVTPVVTFMSQGKSRSRREEPMRLLVLVTIMFILTVVYSVINAHRQADLSRTTVPLIPTIPTMNRQTGLPRTQFQGGTTGVAGRAPVQA